ncbi:MAG: carboxymuconolactone decarboxylase family protein [Proteobacteria bacterium]|nr:carboxymuconolactone decarboxylase family protein [Pseudomonadota bacterium]
MSRIKLVEKEGCDEEAEALFNRMEAMRFSLLNVFKLWANNLKGATGFLHIAEALYLDASLSARYRELAYLRASQVNNCHY